MRIGFGLLAGLTVYGMIVQAWAEPGQDDAGHDFVAEARLLYQLVACGDSPEALAAADARTRKIVASHCRVQKKRLDRFRSKYVEKAGRFLAQHRPDDLPTTVVYPFGGGDLVSALITYPQATEITTISLEHAGDPRRLAQLRGAELRDNLERYRESIWGLLRHHDSASANMRLLETGPIPGQLAFFVQALVALDHELISLRFFRLEDSGTIRYLSREEIAQLEATRARKKARNWVNTDFSVAFSNSELRFRRRGAGDDAPVIVHRHIAANLNNDRFPDSPIHKHLMAKGKVAAITKAASYLLWSHYFSGIRDYLLQNMAFMVSDSTGIAPKHVARAGFEQMVFGRFTGAYLRANEKVNEEFVALWESQPYRALRFRYGYPDTAGNVHLLITRPRRKPPARP